MKKKTLLFISFAVFFSFYASCSKEEKIYKTLKKDISYETCKLALSKFLTPSEKLFSLKRVSLHLSKKVFCRAKIGTKNGFRSLDFDLQGNILIGEQWFAKEKIAFSKKYGKMPPSLHRHYSNHTKARVCLWLSKALYHNKNTLDIPSRSSRHKQSFRLAQRRFRYKQMHIKLRRAVKTLLSQLALKGVSTERASGEVPFIIVRGTKKQIESILSSKNYAFSTHCPIRLKGQKPILSNQAMNSIQMPWLWNYAYSNGWATYETGRNTKMCILEQKSVYYPHSGLMFSRHTPSSPGNTAVIEEPDLNNAKECYPIYCQTNSDCSGVLGKTACISGRCASGTTCSSHSNCTLYGESCQGGKCQEKCPNSMNELDITGLIGEHASHVAGIVNALGASNMGGAPGAVIYSANTASDYSAGLSWCAIKKVDVVNQSYIYESVKGTNGQFHTNVWSLLSDWYSENKNMLIVAGSGNDKTPSTNPYAENVNYNGITVGSYQHGSAVPGTGTSQWSDDILSSFTNILNPNTTSGDLMKPDVVAPGEHIVSTGTTLNSWLRMTGTSQATPFVSSLASQIISWGSVHQIDGQTDFFREKPQLVKAVIKNSSCNRLVADSNHPLSNYEIGQGGISAQLVHKTLSISKYIPHHVGQIDLSPGQDFKQNSFYRWGENGRPGILCFEVAPYRTLRFTFAWERQVVQSGSSYSYGPRVDLDAYLYAQSDLNQNNEPINFPLTTSMHWDNNTETIQWTNQSNTQKNVCVQLLKYYSPASMDDTIRLAWSGVTFSDQCDASVQ